MAIGVVLQAIGIGVSVFGAVEQTAAADKAEKLREQQMNLDAQRQKRDIVRNSILANSQAVSTATNQGAASGSALPGAYGQISGRAGDQTLAVDQNQEIGRGIFAANRASYSGSLISDFGSGLTSLGNMFLQDAGTINKVGQSLIPKFGF